MARVREGHHGLENEDGTERRFPLAFVKKQVARSTGKLLRYARELEAIAENVGEGLGYVVYVLGGSAIALGLLLAPFAAGGLIALSVAGVAGSGIEVADWSGGIIMRHWEASYMAKAKRDGKMVLQVVSIRNDCSFFEESLGRDLCWIFQILISTCSAELHGGILLMGCFS